jgi:hypothetical protein
LGIGPGWPRVGSSSVRRCSSSRSLAAFSKSRFSAALPRDGAERLEARAYFDALELLERLGATGGGDVVAAALERRLEER